MIQELKIYLRSAVECGSLTTPSDVKNQASFDMSNENKLIILETKVKINFKSEDIIRLWLEKVQSDCNNIQNACAYFENICTMLNDSSVKNQFINLLDDIPDGGLIIKDCNMLLMRHLFSKLEARIPELQRINGSKSIQASFRAFEAFLSMIFIRRSKRVNEWIFKNTDKFDEKEDRDRINKFMHQANNLLSNLEVRLKLCGNECGTNGCKYLCLLPRYHENDNISSHNCFNPNSEHKCIQLCDYCVDESRHFEENITVEVCGYPAGHDGRHDCRLDRKDHTCRKQCSLNKWGNCNGKCSKQSGHDGNCDCLAYHTCGKACDANNCQQPCRKAHTDGNHSRHDCGSTVCLSKCEVMCGDPLKHGDDTNYDFAGDNQKIRCNQPC